MDNVIDINGRTLNNNRRITIATANSRKALKWANSSMFLPELIDRLKNPTRTQESLEHYLKMPKSQQDELKDVGGFVGGSLRDGLRRANNVEGRDLIALDLDNIPVGETDSVLKKISSFSCFFLVYSTRKHSAYAPRLRVVFPLDRTVTAEEYEPIARYLANAIDMKMADPTTFEASRLMYWPSCSADSEYIFKYSDMPFVNADGILATYKDWKNIAEWPRANGEELNINRLIKRQEDPLLKAGTVGAFCRLYPVQDAISRFIPEAYMPTDMENRLTYAGGSTSGGAVVYEDKFLFSHHATDPVSGKLCNAFDLVRLHMFGDLDDDAKLGTPSHKMPSFGKMLEYVDGIQEVKQLVAKEEFEAVRESVKSEYEPDAETGAVAEAEDITWYQNLDRKATDGKIDNTRANIIAILGNEPALKGRIVYDEFANRFLVLKRLPWDLSIEGKKDVVRDWGDQDDAQLRVFLEQHYGITGDNKIADGLIAYAHNSTINATKDYLFGLKWDGVKRLDTVLIDYLGAEDNVYTRAVMRKMLVAAVERAVIGGTKFDQMAIIVGPQGIGKSTVLGILGGEWFNDSLQTFEGKEAAELIQGAWIIEVGELSAMNRSETNAVKQFLSKTHDTFRKAYGRSTGKYPRRCVFFGTSNDSEFLKDATGNRRFWPVDVGIKEPTKDVWKDLYVERDQIWAEAVTLFRLGESLRLSGEEERIANEAQESHREGNVKEGFILEFLKKKITTDWQTMSLSERMLFYAGQAEGKTEVKRDSVCALEIWCECFGSDPKFMKRRDSVEINNILAALPGWERTKSTGRFGYCGVQRGFVKMNNYTK